MPDQLRITRLLIRNFRSIDRQEISANRITSFVGQNDAGKSNVLRALNLFFNGESELGQPFDFDRDFNRYTVVPQKQAAQIEIVVYLSLPPSYQREDYPSEVKWQKVWRATGPLTDREFRGYVNNTDFPPYSKIPTLLDRIRYHYVPAIKAPDYFTHLQGRLYSVLASVAAREIRDSAHEFEGRIQNHIEELLASLHDILPGPSAMRLPEDLTQIFENLVFSADGIPLTSRGDGIKVRHIPKILRFMAEKENSILGANTAKYFHVWGYEEPENNIEMAAAFEMADQFVEMLSESDRFQLFLTTHSPIFYGMHDPGEAEDTPLLRSYYVERVDRETVIEHRDRDKVDQSMGFMPLVAPFVKEAKEDYDALMRERNRLRDIAERRSPAVFLEGQTDLRVLTKALEVFAPGAEEDLLLFAGNDADYGSANALASRALAWILEMRHRPDRDVTKALALFDSDDAGTNAYTKLKDDISKLGINRLERLIEIRKLEIPERLVDMKRKGYRMPVDLESHYSDALWEHADLNGWLDDVALKRSRLGDALLDRAIEEQVDLFGEILTDDDRRRLLRRFTDAGKQAAVVYIENLPIGDAQRELSLLRPVVTNVLAALLPNHVMPDLQN